MLEDERNTELAPTWDDTAVFDTTVRILNRPDVKGPAYYEFRVAVDGQRMGYIVVSAGGHDHPVPHWNFEGPSPTESLDQESDGGEIQSYYKLDTLSYVAENKVGNMIANIGGLPPRIESENDLNSLAKTAVTEEKSQMVDSDSEKVQGDGPDAPAPFRLTSWGDTRNDVWNQLKSQFTQTYHMMAQSLKEAAAEDWEADDLADKYGEGLVADETFKLALLYPNALVHVSGEGAKFISIDQVESAPDREVLLLKAKTSNEDKEELPLQVKIEYPNGLVENLPFTIIPRDEEPRNSEDDETERGWTAWTYFWAGAHSHQRLYNQIPKNSSPNTSSCASGCGATAWAMLFGWADERASWDSNWSHRWCMYKQNGGISTPNVVAPKYMDSGVKNMIWEIRNDISTFCWGNSGATYPWKMINAYKYLKPRCGYNMKTDYNSLGITTSGLREKARNSIRDRGVPAIIGTGWLSHYPLAYGYAWRKKKVKKCVLFVCWHEWVYSRWFYVNQGWSGSQNGYISADTWFAGRFYA